MKKLQNIYNYLILIWAFLFFLSGITMSSIHARKSIHWVLLFLSFIMLIMSIGKQFIVKTISFILIVISLLFLNASYTAGNPAKKAAERIEKKRQFEIGKTNREAMKPYKIDTGQP